MEFDWDEHNLFHRPAWRHARGCGMGSHNGPVFVRDEMRNGEERRSRLGRNSTGRILFVVTTERGNRVRVVTSFFAGRALREYYLQRKAKTQ